jgi:mutator protein MutT
MEKKTKKMTQNEACVALLVNNSKKVFTTKRSMNKSAYPGYWEFPGGKKEASDMTLEECAAREIKEECGVELDSNQLSLVGSWPQPPFLVHFFYAKVEDTSEIHCKEDQMDSKWISPKEMLQKEIGPYPPTSYIAIERLCNILDQ